MRHPETGVVQLGACLCSPLLGRFLQVDPIANASANDYDYAAGDPVNYADPTGNAPAAKSCWGWECQHRPIVVVASCWGWECGQTGSSPTYSVCSPGHCTTSERVTVSSSSAARYAAQERARREWAGAIAYARAHKAKWEALGAHLFALHKQATATASMADKAVTGTSVSGIGLQRAGLVLGVVGSGFSLIPMTRGFGMAMSGVGATLTTAGVAIECGARPAVAVGTCEYVGLMVGGAGDVGLGAYGAGAGHAGVPAASRLVQGAAGGGMAATHTGLGMLYTC